ncbi:hypothetical protein SCLCIDRAFT_1218183 [Scleroderma citrinum Foug A]|uniref:Nucleotide-sugar transporter n=1 Tax=Scleroderma citrinum Foug A TaxID=1036808 RepID=A0A0C3DDR2_9AGAM|nr:hypothetical protein SCLCIDRAFT_1218183 [Scleroderma citrinum Foug A]
MSQPQQQPVKDSLVFVATATDEDLEYEERALWATDASPVPTLCGVPLKYISLVTLAVQNSLLTIVMHYSRVHIPPSQSYSAPTAVLLNELLKGAISLAIAFSHIDRSPPYASDLPQPGLTSGRFWHSSRLLLRIRKLAREVFSPDCWKLSIPAILYVIQNNLQYVAATNLEAATFQVSYQMKILTTAAFSVLLLRKQLSTSQWMALFFLAIGVGIVQIQTGASDTVKAASFHLFQNSSMNALKGFLAVVAACFTSGLAGVYFEMVLKNSQSDLWIRNVQLSAFSLLPALIPIVLARHPDSGLISSLFQNFGPWAWATVAIQVVGGLVTAMVIKYSDNILKGFATSLSIVLSFLASIALFDFQITFTFILGSVVVLIATWLYNQPNRSSPPLRLGYTVVKT